MAVERDIKADSGELATTATSAQANAKIPSKIVA